MLRTFGVLALGLAGAALIIVAGCDNVQENQRQVVQPPASISNRSTGEEQAHQSGSPGDARDADSMPAQGADDVEHALFLTPGGAYTEADIRANGNMTASEKFKGAVMSTNGRKPKAGDKLCPVTLTRANPKLTWVVAGKTYAFCCPPCIDEFVKTAKEQPGAVKDPDDFVQK